MSKFILSIDQGTTGSTVSIINSSAQVVAKANTEFPQIFPQPGWVEHNPGDIWSSVLESMNKALVMARINVTDIAAIGITNQRETSLIWDRKTSKPIYNAIVWQCRRTTDFCNQLKRKGFSAKIRRKTGLVLDPYFSGSKFKWILDHIKGSRTRARSGELAAGTVDSFLIWKLTAGQTHYTDVSNASRTLLMDIKKGEWDKELLKMFSVPSEILPDIGPSSSVIGYTQSVPGLPDGIPISGVAGDQQAALFGQTAFKKGQVKCTFGTGSFILMNTGTELVRSKKGLLTTVAWQLGSGQPVIYALEGGAYVCGAAVQWLRDGLKIIKTSSEVEELAQSVADTGGVCFVPALSGLGAPYWNPEARGEISGLTRGSNTGHIARATLEAMALQNVDIIDVMQLELGKKLRAIRVDGGAVANNLLMQIQADLLGCKVERPHTIESTSLGAAYLAGLGIGLWKLQDLLSLNKVEQEFVPQIKPKARQAKLNTWHVAVKKLQNVPG